MIFLLKVLLFLANCECLQLGAIIDDVFVCAQQPWHVRECFLEVQNMLCHHHLSRKRRAVQELFLSILWAMGILPDGSQENSHTDDEGFMLFELQALLIILTLFI